MQQSHCHHTAVSQDIGALDDEENLTILGRHLASMPLPPQLGKLLMYGVLFSCLDPLLTVACSMAYRDPWVIPMTPLGRSQLALFKGRLSNEMGGDSDHLLLVRVFELWRGVRAKGVLVLSLCMKCGLIST